MSDEQRWDKPAFEPPPWEKEAFDELARKRAADQERDRAATQAAAAEAWAARAAAAARPVADEPESPRVAEPDESGVVAPVPEPEPVASPAPIVEPAAEAAGAEAAHEEAERGEAKLDDRQVAAMLLQLEGEEATAQRSTRPLSAAVSIVIGVIGAGMLAVAFYFTAKVAGSAIGLAGALVVGAFGVFFMGTAIWLWVRTTHGKGS